MQSIGAEMIFIDEGTVMIACNKNDKLTQQNGFFHAGVLTSIADSACGYAAYTQMPENADVLTVEYKMNFLKGANAERIIATGKVIQAGKTLIVCEGTVTDEANEKVFAKMIATMITMIK